MLCAVKELRRLVVIRSNSSIEKCPRLPCSPLLPCSAFRNSERTLSAGHRLGDAARLSTTRGLAKQAVGSSHYSLRRLGHVRRINVSGVRVRAEKLVICIRIKPGQMPASSKPISLTSARIWAAPPFSSRAFGGSSRAGAGIRRITGDETRSRLTKTTPWKFEFILGQVQSRVSFRKQASNYWIEPSRHSF
jgi:hypothetical protein